MAYSCVVSTLPGAEAAVDLSSYQYRFVKMTATGVNLCGAGEHCEGVLQNDPVAGVAATVWGPGSTTKVVAGAAVAKGADVTPDAQSRAVTSASGNYIAGRALTAAANAGEIITVFLSNPGRTA